MTLEELRKLYADLSDPDFQQDFWFNVRLTQAAGYETSRNGRGWCRRKRHESHRWLALTHPLSDIKHMLWLIREILPEAVISLDLHPDPPHDGGFPDGDYAAVSLSGERLEDAFRFKGVSPCHGLARAFVAALIRHRVVECGLDDESLHNGG